MKDANGRIRFESREELPLTAMSLSGTSWNKTGSWKFLEPHYRNLTPPCSGVCLTDMDVVAMMRAVEEGDWDGAARVAMEVNPFPSVTGRLCPRPCEQPCNRKAYGGGISVRAVEREVGDHKLIADVRPELPPLSHPRVHVVGSGPAGLSAAVALRRLGHPVTVLEAAPAPGGFLRYGVPEFRLPAEVLRAEIAWTARLGIDFATGRHLCRAEIEALGPTILAVGAGRSRRLGVPGDDLPQVHDGAGLLASIRRGEATSLGQAAAVIGGGNVAIDVARSLRRLGTLPVVYYRRTAREMPAFRGEVEDAKAEGVRFEFQAAPVRVEHALGGRLRLTLAKPGSEVTVEVDAVVAAIGALRDESMAAPTAEGGTASPDPSDADVARLDDDLVAAGACAGHAGTSAAEAIRAGRLAAHALHEAVTGRATPPADPLAQRGADPEIAKFKALNMAYFRKEAPHAPSRLRADARLETFRPTEGNLGLEEARAEAARCFKCGTCVECDVCFHLCPDIAISRNAGGGYSIDLAHCKGCGVCVEECPRAAIHLRKTT